MTSISDNILRAGSNIIAGASHAVGNPDGLEKIAKLGHRSLDFVGALSPLTETATKIAFRFKETATFLEGIRFFGAFKSLVVRDEKSGDFYWQSPKCTPMKLAMQILLTLHTFGKTLRLGERFEIFNLGAFSSEKCIGSLTYFTIAFDGFMVGRSVLGCIENPKLISNNTREIAKAGRKIVKWDTTKIARAASVRVGNQDALTALAARYAETTPPKRLRLEAELVNLANARAVLTNNPAGLIPKQVEFRLQKNGEAANKTADKIARLVVKEERINKIQYFENDWNVKVATISGGDEEALETLIEQCWPVLNKYAGLQAELASQQAKLKQQTNPADKARTQVNILEIQAKIGRLVVLQDRINEIHAAFETHDVDQIQAIAEEIKQNVFHNLGDDLEVDANFKKHHWEVVTVREKIDRNKAWMSLIGSIAKIAVISLAAIVSALSLWGVPILSATVTALGWINDATGLIKILYTEFKDVPQFPIRQAAAAA